MMLTKKNFNGKIEGIYNYIINGIQYNNPNRKFIKPSIWIVT